MRKLEFLTSNIPFIELDAIARDQLVAVALPSNPGFAAALTAAGARDVLLIERTGPIDARRDKDHATIRYAKAKSVFENNCRVGILQGTAATALMLRKTLSHFDTILVRIGLPLILAAPAIARHLRRKRIELAGKTRVETGGRSFRYLVFRTNVVPVDNRRQYATAGLSPIEILRRLDGLDYIVLRWPEIIEQGTHEGDIDLLVSTRDAGAVAERFSDRVSTYPLDVYSEDGSGGYFFARAPYYLPGMARRMINAATTSPSGIRSTSALWRYLSFAYHLLFHIKSRRVPVGTNEIGPATYRSPKYFAELQRLAAAAGEPVPTSFDDIEAALKRADAWPGIDLLGFYAEKNPFLKHRYFEKNPPPPGLMTVFVRDFGRGSEPVDGIAKILASKFEILAQGPVTDLQRASIIKGVRGGNWSDPAAPGGHAYPIHWFICWDRHPVPPNRRSRKKRPRVDNENVNLKYDIREALGENARKQQRLIHTSDNSTEAFEHVQLLGVADLLADHPAACLNQNNKKWERSF